jgi:hypothetical protein
MLAGSDRVLFGAAAMLRPAPACRTHAISVPDLSEYSRFRAPKGLQQWGSKIAIQGCDLRKQAKMPVIREWRRGDSNP